MADWASRGLQLALLAALPCSLAPLHGPRAQESASSAQARRASQCRADYELRARLDAPQARLTGREQLRFTNHSAESVSELWFHLYLNAFANTESTHLVESGGALRGVEMEQGWGWSRITAARWRAPQGPVDLLPSLRARTPPDGTPDDLTVASLALPQAVAPGAAIELELEWECQLPRVRRRTGYKGDFFLVAQWFPKLGVWEAGRGWNCHAFHANTEFFSDYGSYRVALDLPAEYEGKVGGSGLQVQSLRKPDGRVEIVFEAPSPEDRRLPDATGRERRVHDFTWTADPDYVVYNNTFRWRDWAASYAEEVAAARQAFAGIEEPTLRDVDVTVLLQPEHAEQAERHYRATCAALFFYGLWFGEYPYEHITVVDPAHGAGGASGMEYPTLFTAGTGCFAPLDGGGPEGVTVHECGHQFWYGLVGNNEFESAWLDEGFNSFTDSEVQQRVWGDRQAYTRYSAIPWRGVQLAPAPGGGALADVLALRRLSLPAVGALEGLRASGFLDAWREQPWFSASPQSSNDLMEDRIGYLRSPRSDAIDTPGWRFVDRESYRNNSYPRPAAALRTLRGLVGEAAFLRGMRHYARSWRYAHPRPDDFFRDFAAGAKLDQDLGWYFEQLFRSTEGVDWSVGVEQARNEPPRGLFPSPTGEFEPRAASAERASEPWRARITLRRNGAICLPLPVRITFEDGTRRDEVWTREEQLANAWKRFEIVDTRALRSVELDPERHYYIDGDLSNDAWYEQPAGLAPKRWAERVYSGYAQQLFFYLGLGG